MLKNNFSTVLALVAIVLAIGGYFYPRVSSTLGAATPGTRFPHGITVGLPANSPTNIGDIKAGSCNLVGADVSQAASSSAAYDCAITGIVSTDNVLFQLASSTVVTGGNYFSILSSKASTTAGFGTVVLWNNGTASAPSARNVGSSTSYLITKTQ